MKKYLSILLIFTIILTMGLFTTACSKDDDSSSADSDASLDIEKEDAEDLGFDEEDQFTEDDIKGISFSEEDDEAVINRAKSDPSKYYGRWVATSDKATYLYGNVDLTVNEDGTWHGDITGEKLKGKWKDYGDHLHMNNSLFSFDLTFDKSGKLIMVETNSDGAINTVLTRK